MRYSARQCKTVDGRRSHWLALIVTGVFLASLLLPGCAAPPLATVRTSLTSGQAPLTVEFTDTSENTDRFRLDFGDGSASLTGQAGESVAHEYTKAGTYAVTLTVFRAKRPTDTSIMTLSITVGPGRLADVKLSPATARLSVGQRLKFSAVAVDAYDNPLPEARFVWRAATGAGAVASDGTFTAATKAGSFENGITVTAEVDSRSVEAAGLLIVEPGPLDEVKLSPETLRLPAGHSQEFIAEALDVYGNTIPEAQITWEVAEGAGTMTRDGLFTAGSEEGTFSEGVVVTAGWGTLSAEATASVTVVGMAMTLYAAEVHGLRATVNGITDTWATGISWDWGDGTHENSWFPASHAYGTGGTYTVTATAHGPAGATVTKTTAVRVSDQPVTPPGNDVVFLDLNLEAAVRIAIDKPEGAIEASDLESLTSLTAEQSSIADITGLEYCVNLSDLRLGENAIRDLSPLSGLVNLQTLWIWTNDISDLTALVDLANLQDLNFVNNGVTDLSPLSGLVNLTGLGAAQNNISDIAPLASLTKMRMLNLLKNDVSDLSPLASLVGLEQLLLDRNNIRDISSLANLVNLRWLLMPDNQVSDLSPLTGLTKLERLFLSNNNISDFSPLANLVNLQYLDLSNSNVSDVSVLAALANLKHLYLSNNNISDISPLVRNAGLATGDTLDLTSNPLSTESVEVLIPQLEQRGVEVLR